MQRRLLQWQYDVTLWHRSADTGFCRDMLVKMAEQRPPTVGEVLALEFSRLRATGRYGPLETQQQKAEFLKLDKASLNPSRTVVAS